MLSSKPKNANKTHDAFMRLKAMALELGPETKMPTVQQLRRDLQVSTATLDGVLARLEGQKVIYRRQGSGIYVSPYLNKKTVGLVCAPEFFRAGISPFWSEIVEDLRRRAASHGEVFRFYLGLPSSRSEMAVHEDLQDDIAARRLDGVFFIGYNPGAARWIEQQGVPVVGFAGRFPYHISIDYDDLVAQALNALVAVGRKHIALISPFEYKQENQHLHLSSLTRNFESLLLKQGLTFHCDWVWDAQNIEGAETKSYQEQGFEATLRFFSTSNSRPDGIIIVDDMAARGALAGLRKLNIEVGQEVQIASHTNKNSSVLHDYNSKNELILLEVDPSTIVQTMFEMLETLMNGDPLATPLARIRACRK